MKYRHLFILVLSLMTISLAQAEKADREKPINIEADRISMDDINKVQIFEGSVVMTQGTMLMRTDKLVVTQDEDGFQKGVATGGANGLAYFRQKRDNADDYMEGHGERVEHNARTEQTQFFNRAWVKNGQDEVKGSYISYDALTENYVANSSGAKGNSTSANSKVRVTIVPKAKNKPDETGKQEDGLALKPSQTTSDPENPE